MIFRVYYSVPKTEKTQHEWIPLPETSNYLNQQKLSPLVGDTIPITGGDIDLLVEKGITTLHAPITVKSRVTNYLGNDVAVVCRHDGLIN